MEFKIVCLVLWLTFIGLSPTEAACAQFSRSGVLNFTDHGLTGTLCGRLIDLEGADVTLTLVARGAATVSCTNSSGRTKPGDSVAITVTGTAFFSATQVKNGNLSFCVSTEAPKMHALNNSRDGEDFWISFFEDMEFSSARLTVRQNGKVVLRKLFPL